MGLDSRGMPLGLQLVGRPFAEAMLLRVARRFEDAAGTLPAPRVAG
jgi:aspartyl-tRNA(Asn)/glutamyl-tRNA(Gln) amidotransferase subunit A